MIPYFIIALCGCYSNKNIPDDIQVELAKVNEQQVVLRTLKQLLSTLENVVQTPSIGNLI